MAGEVQVRTGGLQDLQELMRLADLCSEVPHWTPAMWRQVVTSAEGEGRRAVLIAEEWGRMIGFGVIGLAVEVAEIESVAVDAASRRKGVGRSLCLALLAWAETRGAERVVLEVRVSNRAARALYEALGFREQGVRRRYYDDPVEDAIVMAREVAELHDSGRSRHRKG